MKKNYLVLVGGALIFAYSLVGPVLREALQAANVEEQLGTFLAARQSPVFELLHIDKVSPVNDLVDLTVPSITGSMDADKSHGADAWISTLA